MSTIGLIDYGMGNLHSVQRAFERLGSRIQAVTTTEQMQGCDASCCLEWEPSIPPCSGWSNPG